MGVIGSFTSDLIKKSARIARFTACLLQLSANITKMIRKSNIKFQGKQSNSIQRSVLSYVHVVVIYQCWIRGKSNLFISHNQVGMLRRLLVEHMPEVEDGSPPLLNSFLRKIIEGFKWYHYCLREETLINHFYWWTGTPMKPLEWGETFSRQKQQNHVLPSMKYS